MLKLSPSITPADSAISINIIPADDLTTTIGEVRYTWSQNGDVTVTGPDFEVRWQSSNGYITYYRHDQYNPVVHFRMVVKPNGVVETASADTNHHYTFVPFTNAAADGPASVPVSNLVTSYAGPTTAGTKLELKDNTTPYYRYVDNYSRDGGVTNPEVYVLNYNLDSNFGGGWTGAGFAQKSKLNRFVIWSDKIADKPLVFANDIEFIRDTEDHLSLYVDGASFNGTVYGTKYGDIDKSSPYWAAWISALEGSGSAIQYYKVKGSDGQSGTDVVINCRPVSVLGPPKVYGKRILYEEAVRESGTNLDKWKLIKVDNNSVISSAVLVPDDDLFNYEYKFTVDGKEYRSELLPYISTNFVIKPKSPINLSNNSWFDKITGVLTPEYGLWAYTYDLLATCFSFIPINSHPSLLSEKETRAFLNVLDGEKLLYWNRTDQPIKGDAVVALQKLLGNVRITGEFKQATENAVEDFIKANAKNGLPLLLSHDVYTAGGIAGPLLYGMDNYINDTRSMATQVALGVATEIAMGIVLGALAPAASRLVTTVLKSALEKLGMSRLFTILTTDIIELVSKQGLKGTARSGRIIQGLGNAFKKIEPGTFNNVEKEVINKGLPTVQNILRKWNVNGQESDLFKHAVDYFFDPKYKNRFKIIDGVLRGEGESAYKCVASDGSSMVRQCFQYNDDALEVVKRGLANGDCYFNPSNRSVYIAVKGEGQYATKGIMVNVKYSPGAADNGKLYSLMDIDNGWQEFLNSQAKSCMKPVDPTMEKVIRKFLLEN